MQQLLFPELTPICPDCGAECWLDRYESGDIWNLVLPPAYYCPQCGIEVQSE